MKKFFDVACTLIDVMTCVPIEPQSLDIGPRDYLNHLMTTIAQLRGGRDRYLPILLAKTQDALPQLSIGPSPSLDTYFEEWSSNSDGSMRSSPSLSVNTYDGQGDGQFAGVSRFVEVVDQDEPFDNS